MIGTRSLQWGAVVMTTQNIQKAVVETTLSKIYACMESVTGPDTMVNDFLTERTHGSAMLQQHRSSQRPYQKRNNWRVMKPDCEKQCSKVSIGEPSS
jgi:hypothetical protein